MSLSPLTLSPDRMQFLEDGYPWVWRGTLTWSLYGRYLHQGMEAALAVLRDRQACGANTVCCSLMLSWGFPFSPVTPGFWSGLTPFVRTAADEGLRLCFIIFADTRSLMPNHDAQVAHWQRIYTHLGGEPNVTLLLVNQPGHHSQDLDLYRFDPPPPIAGFPALLAARANPFEDHPPILPAWSFSAFAAKRNDPNWFMEAGCGSMWYTVNGFGSYPGTQQATVLFEPAPAGRRPEWTDPGKWRQFARSCCFRGTVGANFYSDYDARSEIYPAGVVRDCAVEFLGNLPRP